MSVARLTTATSHSLAARVRQFRMQSLQTACMKHVSGVLVINFSLSDLFPPPQCWCPDHLYFIKFTSQNYGHKIIGRVRAPTTLWRKDFLYVRTR